MNNVQINNSIKYCIVCKEPLTNENWSISSQKRHYYICKECRRKKERLYYHTNKEEILKQLRENYKLNGEEIRNHRKENYEKNRESINLKQRIYKRNNFLCTTDENGKSVGVVVRKRTHSLKCELCGEEVKTTAYHHWIDEHLEWGLWMCLKCHMFVEGIEKGLGKDDIDKYLELKKKVESGEI